jgi:TIMELESS-interacting protein
MAAAAPTGCFKCGRPGHWSRDCPSSSAPAAASDADAPTNPSRPSAASRFNAKPRPPAAAAPDGDGTDGGAPPQPQDGKNTKKKKERATRPKLTPDLLLSDGGIGFVLRYFPKAFKPHARPGHEVLLLILFPFIKTHLFSIGDHQSKSNPSIHGHSRQFDSIHLTTMISVSPLTS